MLNVLVACEESQAVCKEFRKLGHRAFSCDIQECSGGHPEWHIQGDALAVINGNCTFVTADGCQHRQDGKWDILIAHPPCTYLTVSGNAWFNVEKYGEKAIKRAKDREEAIEFFMEFANADCDRIAIENPIGVMSRVYRKPNCIIQPYWFGDPVRKPTCLWLKNLPSLVPTDMVEPNIIRDGKTSYSGPAYYAVDENGKIIPWNDPRTKKIRSKTYPGFAKAMAKQWSEFVAGDDPYDIVDDYIQYKLFE